MTRRRQYWFSILLFAATAAWAVAQPTPDEVLEQNRRAVDALRKNADQMARLRDNVQHFLALPEKKRENIVQLDKALHDWPAAKKARFTGVLERYADWLEQLRQDDPAAFKAIKDAPNAESRLALIKDRRDREWMQSQPRTQRELWAQKPAEERGAYVATLRQDERQRHQKWVIAQRFWKELENKKELPCRLSDFSDKVKSYVKDFLLPKLTAAEKQQLDAAEGRWPDYPLALVEIAAKRPSALPSLRAEDLPRKFAELPAPIQKHLTESKKTGKEIGKGKLKKNQYTDFDGSPYFASKVVEIAMKEPGKGAFEHEYLACSYKSLLKPMKEFVDVRLMPALKDHPADDRKFKESEGKWPDYPQTIQELSQKYNLQPPWHILPEPEKWKWDNYRYLRRRLPDAGKDQTES